MVKWNAVLVVLNKFSKNILNREIKKIPLACQSRVILFRGVKMSVYGEILYLLNKPVMSSRVIFKIFKLLDDYSCNSIHDGIFDLLFEFLISNDTALLENAKQICIDNLEN